MGFFTNSVVTPDPCPGGSNLEPETEEDMKVTKDAYIFEHKDGVTVVLKDNSEKSALEIAREELGLPNPSKEDKKD